MTAPAGEEGALLRRTVHLVRRLPCAPLAPAIAADAASGLEAHVVLLHDAVTSPEAARPAGGGVTVHVLADDRRRRGLDAAEDAVDYDALVALMDGAARVVSW